MPEATSQTIRNAFRYWWRQQKNSKGTLAAGCLLLAELWGFLRDSTPERRRSRYGDMDYDWEHHVNTTGGALSWRERLLGIFNSPYQPTDPAAFAGMMAALPIDFRHYTFIDIGSGKGRTLLMASEYPFPKIVGVEILPDLHRATLENIAAYRAHTPAAGPAAIESICIDARQFIFPETPLVVYLFNPLPEPGLREMIHNLEHSWKQSPRPIWIVYHNPVLESVVSAPWLLARTAATPQFSVYRSPEPSEHEC